MLTSQTALSTLRAHRNRFMQTGQHESETSTHQSSLAESRRDNYQRMTQNAAQRDNGFYDSDPKDGVIRSEKNSGTEIEIYTDKKLIQDNIQETDDMKSYQLDYHEEMPDGSMRVFSGNWSNDSDYNMIITETIGPNGSTTTSHTTLGEKPDHVPTDPNASLQEQLEQLWNS